MVLYLDNIRGFKEEYIELNDVNFLVGENSTGKTSLLSILSLFFQRETSSAGFKNEYVDLGTFDEIRTKNSPNKRNFCVGFITNKNDILDIAYDAQFLIFKEEDGYPIIEKALCFSKKSLLTLNLNDNELNYSLKKQTSAFNIDSIKLIIKSITKKGYKDVDLRTDTEGTLKSLFFYMGNIDFIRRSPSLLLNELSHLFLFRNPDERKLFADFISNRSYSTNNVVWFNPIRSHPLPIYQNNRREYSPGGDHIASTLREIFKSKESNKEIIESIKEFGRSTGLFDNIAVDSYGDSIDSPIYIKISLQGKELKIPNVGYGVSQILPILVEVVNQSKSAVFLVQQPEVHLHPKSQAFCGEFFFKEYVEDKKRFIIETHSDFVIDRFRLLIRTSKDKEIHKKINILFFESDENGNKVHTISIDKNGNYPDTQPQKFRDFFLQEGLTLLGF